MIDAEKYYSLTQIIQENFIPWIKSLPTLRSWVKRDDDLFKTITTGEKHAKRYFVKGSTLLEIIKLADTGKLKNYGSKRTTV